MRRLTRDEVRVDVAADADTLDALVADVTRTAAWSAQVRECSWLPPAEGPAVGARFRAGNGAGRHTWSNVPIVETANPGREFAIVRSARLREPSAGGTGSTPTGAERR